MKATKSLLLVWKNNKNSLYYHIGTLLYDEKKYVFEYTYKSKSSRNVHEAIKNGYFLHPAFPELEKKYVSEDLFVAFDRRIPNRSRIGYENILTEFNLQSDADRMDLLRETRGAIASDEYTFEEPLRLNGNQLETTFYVNGMRHLKSLPNDWYNCFQKNQLLDVEIDEGNQYDAYAVKIFTKQKKEIGYVPGIYAKAVYKLLQQGITIDLEIKELKKHMAPQWWVRVQLKATIDVDGTDTLYSNNLDDLIFKDIA